MKPRVLLTVLAVSVALTGCSPRFSCKDSVNLTDPRCSSVSAMYDTKMRGMPDPLEAEAKKKDRSKDGAAIHPVLASQSPDQGVAILRSMSPDSKIPVRVPPKVIRIWLAPWEDADGDLHQPGLIFSEINDKRGRWVFGEKQTSGSQPLLTPIERLQDDSKETSGKGRTDKTKTGDASIRK